MSRDLIVSNNTYAFPDQGANPAYGEVISDWAEAVTDSLAGLSPSGDILARTANIGNNTSGVVTGLSFDSTLIRGATVLYSIYRTSTTISTPKAETGILQLDYDGTTWNIAREATQDTGITFTVSSAGVVSFSSTDVGATSYTGTMSYRAYANSQS